MTARQTLIRARKILTTNNIEEPALESELLLSHTLNVDRIQLHLYPERELSPEEDERYRNLIERRLKREPTAYITGHREFYGLDFYINEDVLIPRPESELLVEKALSLARQHNISTIAEVGTGCGAIAISLASNLPPVKIYATDISEAALKVTWLNCLKHGMANRVHLRSGDLLDALPEPVDLIVANLPYIKQSDLPHINTRDFEPSVALDGGKDGLEQIRRLCPQVNYKLKSGGYLLLEIGQGQSRTVTSLLHNAFPLAGVEVLTDLSGIDRVVSLYYVIDRQYSA